MGHQLAPQGGHGPERVELSKLGRPAQNQPIVELRFINQNGDTEAWLIRRETLDFEGLSSPTRVRVAYLDRGVDTRLATQKASIERLGSQLYESAQHISAHHRDIADGRDMPEGPWVCNWKPEAGS